MTSSIPESGPLLYGRLLVFLLTLFLGACASTYYGAMEKVGVPKRDILVDRVEDARDSQLEAQEQFKSALAQFGSVVELEQTDLKQAYDTLNGEYQDSRAAAKEVSGRIEKVESVSDALFAEWKKELKLYESAELRAASRKRYDATLARYQGMLAGMHEAEASMQPVLNIFRDNVLFLKHNLNAQAIGSLAPEFETLQLEIDSLISKMNASIEQSNQFIAQLQAGT